MFSLIASIGSLAVKGVKFCSDLLTLDPVERSLEKGRREAERDSGRIHGCEDDVSDDDVNLIFN